MSKKLLAGICAGICAAGAATVTELPLTEVVLYSSGVGAFAHQGRISGDTSLRFRMSAEQLNDLLKSLYVTASDTGVSIKSVTYPTELPLNTLLAGYRIKISDVHSLTDILRQLQGEEFTVTVAGATAPTRGKLITVETKTVTIGNGAAARTEKVDFALMMTEKGIQRFPVAELTSVLPTDLTLLSEMNRALKVLAAQHDRSAKTIEVNLSTDKGASIRAAYVIEAPVWKASYRLELGGKAGEKAHLQGWALVENPTNSEWKEVTLSLISGRPVSFVQDLYTSLYLPRPKVFRENYLSPRRGAPVVRKCALPESDGFCGAMGNNLAKQYAPPARAAFRRVDGTDKTETGAIGELYCYRIAKPVTLGSRQSAMLELVSTPVTAGKVSYYSFAAGGERPLNAVLLKNDCGMLLPQGPATIFEGKNYGGDASLADLAAGGEQLLTYGLDLEVAAIPSEPSELAGQISELTVDRGTLKYSVSRQVTYQCTFDNRSAKAKTILFETPKNSSGKIINGMKPAAVTADSFRFFIPLNAGEKRTAEVKIEIPEQETIAVDPDYDFGQLTVIAGKAELAPEAKATAEKLFSFSRRIRESLERLQNLEEKIKDLAARHERTRSSINANISSELRTRLNKRLAETDEELDKLYQKKEAEKAELQKLRREFGEFLGGKK